MIEYTMIPNRRFRAPNSGSTGPVGGAALPTGSFKQGDLARTPLDN